MEFFLHDLNIHERAVYEYQYEYTGASQEVRIADGTYFYELDYPRINTTFYILQNNEDSGIRFLFRIATPVKSEKYFRYPEASLRVDYAVKLSKSMKINLFAAVSAGGGVTEKPCVDGQGKTFHCYHGVNRSSPLYTLPYDEVIKLTSRTNAVKLNNVGVMLEWSF